MAATTLLSDNGVTSGITGYQLTGGNDGTLQLQTTTAGGTATTAMTIDTSQNVGIGTTSPLYKLDMVGQARVVSSSNAYALTLQYNAATSGVALGSPSANTLSFSNSAGTEFMRLDSSGNLGVGNTAPAADARIDARLDNSGSTAWIRIQNQSGTANSKAGFKMSTVNGDWQMYANRSGGFYIDTPSVASAVSVDNSGNVGIGAAPNNTSLTLAQAKNLSWQWASNGYNYANIFNQTSSAALILGSGYQQSNTANGFASSVPVSWDRSALKVSSGGISLYTDSPATVAVGTDITPTLRVNVDNSGRMRVSYQPSFSAYSPQSVGSGNIVKYINTRSNVGSCYDTSTGVFTAPIAGVYVFTFNSLMNVNGDYVRLLFRWNGTASTQYGDTLSGGTAATAWAGWSYISIGMSWVVSLGQGDTVSVWNDGPCTTWGTGYGTFSGYMLG